MDAATSAALIGAGVGAGSSLLAQLLTHRLSLSRDRRSQIRDQRLAAVETAALSLARSEADVNRPDAPKESILGQHPEILPLAEGLSEAVAVLQVHFGTDHRIVKSYAETWGTCAQAKVEVAAYTKVASDRLRASSESLTQDAARKVAEDEIGAAAKALNKALNARDAWMKEALREARKT